MKNRNRLHGIWIPIEFLLDSGLSKSEAILLSDIAYFEEYYKSREDISKLLGVNQTSVSTLLKQLEDKGYIQEIGKVYNKKIYCVADNVRNIYNKETKTKNIDTETVTKDELFIQRIHKMLDGKKKLRIVQPHIVKLKQRRKKWSDDEILKAAYNLSQSDWHMGKNDDGRKYASVEFLLRNDKKIEEWLNQEIKSRQVEQILDRII